MKNSHFEKTQYSVMQSRLVDQPTLAPNGFGRINERCGLVIHLIIHGAKMLPTQNVRIAKQLDY